MNTRGYHIHITGCVPRSGTTLMKELMVNCFEIDATTEHELSVYDEYVGPYSILCTKKIDIKRISFPFKIDKYLYIIYMLRDPRDAISSRSHRDNTENSWGNLKSWIENQKVASKFTNHPRFVTIRYEDLVSAPNATQSYIYSRVQFLKEKQKFSEFHKYARPSDEAIAALSGLRPITDSSVWNWRRQLPFIKAQIQKYGDISGALIDTGYETDASWLAQLDTVVADNSAEKIRNHSLRHRIWLGGITKPRRNLLYLLSILPFIGPMVSLVRSKIRNFLVALKISITII